MLWMNAFKLGKENFSVRYKKDSFPHFAIIKSVDFTSNLHLQEEKAFECL